MGPESVTAADVVAFLNELVDLDVRAMAALVNARVMCNQELAEHPSVQVVLAGNFHVGLLGILNGLFGVDQAGCGPIVAIVDTDDGLRKFALAANWQRRGK